jgi:hypothetical protein
MHIEPIGHLTAIEIQDALNLDPILVIFRDIHLGAGEVFIRCYGAAWTSYWGAMGNRTVRQFVASCDADYLVNNLVNRGLASKELKRERDYLHRIVEAVLKAVRTVGADQCCENDHDHDGNCHLHPVRRT